MSEPFFGPHEPKLPITLYISQTLNYKMAECGNCDEQLNVISRYFECDQSPMCFTCVHRPTRMQCDHCGRLRKRLLYCRICEYFSCMACYWGGKTCCAPMKEEVNERFQTVVYFTSKHLLADIANTIGDYDKAPITCSFTIDEQSSLRRCTAPGCDNQARERGLPFCLKCTPNDIAYIEYLANPTSMRLLNRRLRMRPCVRCRHETLTHFVESRPLNARALRQWMTRNRKVCSEIRMG